jgi:hypothetical protein
VLVLVEGAEEEEEEEEETCGLDDFLALQLQLNVSSVPLAPP